jgi:hypothetical protein
VRWTLRQQTIAWAVAWIGLLAMAAIAVGTSFGRNMNEVAGTVLCSIWPLWFLALVVWSYPLMVRHDFERQRARAPVVGRCSTCGYDTTGIPDCCPECGSPETGAWMPRPEGRSRLNPSGTPPTRRSLWGWTVAWAVGLAGFIAYLILAFGTHALHHLGAWERGAACFLIPVWFLVLVIVGLNCRAGGGSSCGGPTGTPETPHA